MPRYETGPAEARVCSRHSQLRLTTAYLTCHWDPIGKSSASILPARNPFRSHLRLQLLVASPLRAKSLPSSNMLSSRHGCANVALGPAYRFLAPLGFAISANIHRATFRSANCSGFHLVLR